MPMSAVKSNALEGNGKRVKGSVAQEGPNIKFEKAWADAHIWRASQRLQLSLTTADKLGNLWDAHQELILTGVASVTHPRH